MLEEGGGDGGECYLPWTSMQNCDFNKFAMELCWNHSSACIFSWKFAAYSQNTFYQKTRGRLLLKSKYVHMDTTGILKLAFDQ